jgi:hypothetical protein
MIHRDNTTRKLLLLTRRRGEGGNATQYLGVLGGLSDKREGRGMGGCHRVCFANPSVPTGLTGREFFRKGLFYSQKEE